MKNSSKRIQNPKSPQSANHKMMPRERLEIARGFDEAVLSQILMLERECFPGHWQYNDAPEYYAEMLSDKRSINILLRIDGQTAGYLLATPLEKVRADLSQHDGLIRAEEDRYYVETIEILPEYRGKGWATKLLLEMCEEAKRRGISKFGVHARTINRFNVKLKRIFEGMITECREIETWAFGGDEPYEYIEWTYDESASLLRRTRSAVQLDHDEVAVGNQITY